MSKFGKSQGVGRHEDIRFLTGKGRYVDDIAPADALHALFLRSDHAHGRITGLDLEAARDLPGVHLVLDAAGLESLGVTLGMKGTRLHIADGAVGAGPERPVLARDRVRFVGEAVVMIVADTVQAAQDAAEVIGLDIEGLPVSLALSPGGPQVHAEAPENRAFHWQIGDGAAVDAAFAAAAHRVTLEVVHNRIIVNAMEPRGCFAQWDGARLHFCVNGQGVWNQRNELARMLGLPRDAVRVTNPDVGGGFGMKAMTYPEYVCVAAAARDLGRPVRWIATRGESMLTDNAGRDLVAVADLAFDSDLRVTGYRVNLVSNLGAYNSQYGQAIQSELFSKVLTGVYDISAAHLRAVGVYTNTTPVDAYRGAGRPEAILTIERAMDEAARQLGVDPFDLRMRNFITSFPYRSATGELIDVGDFPRVLARAKAEADVAGFAARQADSAARGMLRGIGLATYIESILGDADESARLVLDRDGGATLYVGTQSNGQGHETVYARMVAEWTGLPEQMVRIVQGDSDAIPKGGGTGGSRSVTVQGTAMRATVRQMVAGFTAFLAEEWEADDVGFDGTSFGAAGSNTRLTMAEAADLARLRGRSDLLDVCQTTTLDGRSYPNGAHVAEVEVDPETGAMVMDRYIVVDDFGTLIAPDLAIGQVHGGVAQGYGQAVCEVAHYDYQGQLLTASFMDYAMPRASDLPMFGFTSEPVPSIMNPFGMKGCGEAGTVGALGAISNAVRDALAQRGVARVDMPFTPARIWHWLKEAENDAA
ncbi:MAG: xanthine dehydrogenase family protein molybdopterin-binding subunit [Pseudotabrizicola sp.]|uniref:xanthine dehydrogenase family protein molybdopterin-binding subunit n=1 Tax=Pseudotabrizicola sp. TaxID=2939647 RepID=UPI0027304DF4|nr:xanthine dehydrogenase family protein molybdopterin-binding subunit [Pseudotabrizicola sp.]MDP2080869.1 xanthine dehydrogenase family protein molybdopterin-binding subunit [Pseudotabrizicola sp.]MDZ7572729.1 xanthine dehydrogenase family protein molybdopterin-binding subunit [Pseudotabrizicola sp.]